MRNRNFSSETKKLFVLTIALCGVLCVPSESNAQFKKLKEKVKKVMTTTTDTMQSPNGDSNARAGDSDDQELVWDAYVCYLTEVERFDRRSANKDEAVRHAQENAANLEGFLRRNPKYHTQSLKLFYDHLDRDITGDDLLNKLKHAREIIDQGFTDENAMVANYAVQGDVDDWLHKTEKLEGRDGFVPMAKREYPLLFNRAQGERELLAGYAKGNNGKPMPANTMQPLHNQIDKLLAEMNRLAPTFTPERGTGAVEPFVATFVKTGVTDYIPGATLLHAVWSPEQQGWLIDKNELGVPLNRRRMGTALFRVPSQKFCVEQHFFYLEHYAGGGRYQRGDDVQFADVRFVKCQ